MQSPQSAATEKKMKLFTSGNASLIVTIDKLGYMQGDVIRASTYVDNSSSRNLKLKYRFEQKQVFYAQGFSQKSSKTIFKVVGDSIPSGSKQTVNADLRIPSNLEQSITNCGIITLEYIFKVYLDVPFATDPAITFSVFLLPAHQRLGPCQNQAYEPNSEPQAAFGPSPPPQATVGPRLSGAAVGPAQGLHPILYPSPAYPQPSSPESPPPSYADIFPTGPGFQTPP
ncbi:hypothetical protein NFI96_016589 [Prochilodus magdalenae]|nr:hypothetical protein NFI96_016589 [Prochilodus magdalenae]